MQKKRGKGKREEELNDYLVVDLGLLTMSLYLRLP